MNPLKLASITIALAAMLTSLSPAQDDAGELRKSAAKLEKDGYYKDALAIYQKLLTSDGGKDTGSDLSNACACLKKLKRVAEADQLVEDAVARHPANGSLLLSAGSIYMRLPHYGHIIAGEFQRGDHRGGGQFAWTTARDRVRAMQLLKKAHDLSDDDATKREILGFMGHALIMNSDYRESWRLQQLTDLGKLPDIEPGNRWQRGGRNPQGAPVDADGGPLFYQLPGSFDAAKNDGERWRFCLTRNKQQMRWAQFLHSQFGVSSLASYGWFRTIDLEEQKGILQLHTLGDNETLARLATGVKRFKLPDDQNFIRIFREQSRSNAGAADTLVQIYLDRRQHEKAAALLRETIEKFPKDGRALKTRRNLLAQITGNWGRFEPAGEARPAGSEPDIDFVFRNAKSVTLVVREVRMDQLIDDLWKHLDGNPLKLNWNRLRWHNLAEDLVNGSRIKYLGREIGRRTHALKPRPHHWDTPATLGLPVKQAGTYLVSAELENGVTTHTVVRIDGVTLVRKDVQAGELYFLADAVTGKPIPNRKVEIFGYYQKHRKKPGMLRKHDVFTKRATKTTDANGTFIIKPKELAPAYHWMFRAKTARGTALLGFGRFRTHVSDGGRYRAVKGFGITDRPVYQPGQKVFGKLWIRQARYDLNDQSTFAGRKFRITIFDPQGSEVLKEQPARADSFGGVEYEFQLPEDAKLGSYQVSVKDAKQQRGQHSFRVEEYKKPEYEVTVDAPKEAVMLGEKFEATVKATYYHGAPVSKATVKVKVTRSRHNDRWFPVGPWDWLYGRGYGWLDVERPWYPGWSRWGCACPPPWWWHRGGEQPEIVLEREMEIGADGTAKVEIDTALAKAVHSDTDHRYEVTAEVVDASRRTIVGTGSTIAARRAFQVRVWLDRGYSRPGEKISASIAARSADGRHIETKGKLTLFRITSGRDGKVAETEVKSWQTGTGDGRNGSIAFQVDKAGQYRLSATLTDARGRASEGAILITVRGKNGGEGDFHYSDIELIVDKRTYQKGENVKLLINTKRKESTVLLSLRGGTGHRFVSITNHSAELEIPVGQKDMPNFFIEAATVSDAAVHSAVREVIVPPEKRILNVEVLADNQRYKPRAEGKVRVRVTDQQGKPVKGSLALTIYDKSLEYISGGSNVADIKSHFWKWRRHFRGGFGHSASHYGTTAVKKGGQTMQTLGAFGRSLAYSFEFGDGGGGAGGFRFRRGALLGRDKESAGVALAAPVTGGLRSGDFATTRDGINALLNNPDGKPGAPPVMVRKDFADLLKWVGSVETDGDGVTEVPVTFPDNLTTWKIRTWAMAHGTRVGQGTAEVITSKDLIIRLQAPRFFVEKDAVVLSAVVHNYLKTDQDATVSLELEGGTMESGSPLAQKQHIKAGGETRIDWRCKVTGEGEAIVRMKAITADDADAMEMTFPVYVHGILKQSAWSRVIAPDKAGTSITVKVPAERRPEQTRLEVRYSPTIAGSIVDAIPYLAEYPYGCTEQTLNRFVPTVVAQKLIREMGVDLEDVRNKRANLNPQEIGDDKERASQWKRWQRNPVFSEKEVNKMTAAGIKKLREMQLSNGGWGWFSGYGEYAYPHTTAVVVHGLLIAKANGASIPDGMINRGVQWLKNHEARETERIRMWKKRKKNTKPHPSATDALVRLVLVEAKQSNTEMLGYLFRDKNKLSVYAKSLLGMSLHIAKDTEKRDAVIRNIEQFLVYDDENQSAHLKLGNGSYWWYWYGSETEAHAWYLKLLAATKPKSKQARGVVKYLVNNRKHATYWNSTRDTAYCIEAIADYMRASGENNPEAEVTVSVDGKAIKTVNITKDNLFSYDNKVVLAGDALGTGEHTVEIARKGKGALYTNAYLTVFTKEDFIRKAGLEVKVDRAYYKLERIKDAKESTAGTRGQVVDHKVEKFRRIPLKRGDMLASGDLVEVELHIHSKNDYEYLIFNDWKPAGLEAVDVRSGYTRSGMHAYMEMRNEKTSFFVRSLARGSHSLKYRLRAEIPGTFSALPTQAEAMYAPELKANSDEMKIHVKDR